MDKSKRLQLSIKRKIVVREALCGNKGYKVKSCTVSYVGSGWYHFNIDSDEFDCRWMTLSKDKCICFFKGNQSLKQAGYTEQGVDLKRVKFASSMFFGHGTSLVSVFWVLGEVIERNPSWECV